LDICGAFVSSAVIALPEPKSSNEDHNFVEIGWGFTRSQSAVFWIVVDLRP
jgi:hypothetical protein